MNLSGIIRIGTHTDNISSDFAKLCLKFLGIFRFLREDIGSLALQN